MIDSLTVGGFDTENEAVALSEAAADMDGVTAADVDTLIDLVFVSEVDTVAHDAHVIIANRITTEAHKRAEQRICGWR